MSDSRQVVVLANPYSGKGNNQPRVAALERALAARGLSMRAVWDLGERKALLGEPGVGEQYRCVVSAGGDGSMAGVVNDLGRGGDTTRVPIAMLPLGNENLFAKAFGHHRGIDALAAAIDTLDTRTIDVGEANGQLFTLMASAGFDSDVVGRVDTWRRATRGNGLKRVNRLSYARPIGVALAGYRYPMVTLTTDAESVSGAHAFVFNINRYGGGLPIGSHADPADGLLDWVVFEKPGLIRLARYGLSAYLRRHLKRGDVKHGRASEITLTSDAGALPIQTDGDPCVMTPATIRVRPGAMRVVLA
ncbi:MAG: diacylglycerol/lipid kinase family protein [Phycisphaeraceae bacterium]